MTTMNRLRTRTDRAIARLIMFVLETVCPPREGHAYSVYVRDRRWHITTLDTTGPTTLGIRERCERIKSEA